MADKQVAIRNDIAASPLTNLTVRDMLQLGTSLVGTGFLPSTIKTPEQAMAIMLKGQELRVPPMYSLSNIVIVQGKPSCSAELMLALIQRDFGQRAMRVKDSTDQSCTVEYRLDGWDDIQSYTFTIKQAEQAGLFKNAVWKSYPAAMLRARCISAVARMAFPGSIGGMVVPGELGESVTVTSDGEIVSAATVSRTIDIETGEIAPTAPDSATAMRRLHAVAKNAGITHAMLHEWAVQAVQVDSLADVEYRFLDGLASKLEDAEIAGAFIVKYAPVDARGSTIATDTGVVIAETRHVETEQASMVDLNDPELIAATERTEAAMRARGDGVRA